MESYKCIYRRDATTSEQFRASRLDNSSRAVKPRTTDLICGLISFQNGFYGQLIGLSRWPRRRSNLLNTVIKFLIILDEGRVEFAVARLFVSILFGYGYRMLFARFKSTPWVAKVRSFFSRLFRSAYSINSSYRRSAIPDVRSTGFKGTFGVDVRKSGASNMFCKAAIT